MFCSSTALTSPLRSTSVARKCSHSTLGAGCAIVVREGGLRERFDAEGKTRPREGRLGPRETPRGSRARERDAGTAAGRARKAARGTRWCAVRFDVKPAADDWRDASIVHK
jgi:hypothetical protein